MKGFIRLGRPQELSQRETKRSNGVVYTMLKEFILLCRLTGLLTVTGVWWWFARELWIATEISQASDDRLAKTGGTMSITEQHERFGPTHSGDVRGWSLWFSGYSTLLYLVLYHLRLIQKAIGVTAFTDTTQPIESKGSVELWIRELVGRTVLLPPSG